MTARLRVLEIGPGGKPQAHLIPEYANDAAEIVYLDIDPQWKPDVIADASQPLPFEGGTFDGVFASHILEHITYWREYEVLEDWARVLKVGGVLHILVPSWEWVARQVLSDKPSRGLKPLAFASQTNPWEVHMNMFTMRQLRRLFESLGLSVYKAISGPLAINAAGEVVVVEQHYIAGIKGLPIRARKEVADEEDTN